MSSEEDDDHGKGGASITSPPAAREKQSNHGKTFGSIGLTPSLVRALSSLRITQPTPIQRESIPLILKGNDLIGGSPTGSGKTLSFALPILQTLLRDMVGGFAVVLTPTRELALQLYEQFVAVGQGAQMGLRVTLVVGGLDIVRQASELSSARPHIIVATPGRLRDIMESGGSQEWGLERCKFVVLDEADRLLSPSFGPELAFLFSALPPPHRRQTLLFTATLTPEIEALANKETPATDGDAKKQGRKPILCKIEQSTSTPPTLVQQYIFAPSHMREPYLYHLLLHAPISANGDADGSDEDDEEDEDGPKVPFSIIFVSKSQTAALLSQMLLELGIPNAALHSTLSQTQRLEALSSFRARTVPILITTDLGSRGLDVPDVDLVVNWDLPRDWRDYIHRVGRTARNGQRGLAVNFVGERDVALFKSIEETIGTTMTEVPNMREDEILQQLNAVMTAKRMAAMHLHDTNFGIRKERNEAKAAARLSSSARGSGASSKHRSKGDHKKHRSSSSTSARK